MKTHTPGPWWFRKHHGSDQDVAEMLKHGMTPVQALSNEGQRFLMSGIGDDVRRIALVDAKSEYKRGRGHLVECEERDANAALLAAAPEMLAALRFVWSSIDRVNHPAAELVRHAIVKATGETS